MRRGSASSRVRRYVGLRWWASAGNDGPGARSVHSMMDVQQTLKPGTIRREYLDHLWYWNRLDLQRKLARFARYYNQARVPSALTGKTPAEQRGRAAPRIAVLRQFF